MASLYPRIISTLDHQVKKKPHVGRSLSVPRTATSCCGVFMAGKFIPSVAAAAQTSTNRNGTGQLDDEDGGGGGDDGDHTYPIVVADRIKRRHLTGPFHLRAANECFCADCCVPRSPGSLRGRF